MEIKSDQNINNDPILPTPERIIRSPRVPAKAFDIFKRLEMIEDASTHVGFHGGSKKRSGLKLALWTWLAAGLDALVLVSTSCFFILVFSFLMKANPNSMFGLFLKNQNSVMMLGILFIATLWTYLIFMRVFIGATLGEWTCGLRLGQPLERFHFSYLIKVTLRTTVVLASGIFIIPLISLLFSRDIAGDISGLKIYSL